MQAQKKRVSTERGDQYARIVSRRTSSRCGREALRLSIRNDPPKKLDEIPPHPDRIFPSSNGLSIRINRQECGREQKQPRP